MSAPRLIVLLAALALPAAARADVAHGIAAWKAGDYTRAVAEWTEPAASGDPEAQVRLAEAYLTGRGIPQDPVKARDLLEKAAAKGQPLAEVNLGLILFRAGEYAKAIPLVERAAARGEPRAQYVLGIALFNGDGIPKDRVRAYATMAKSADAGLPQAKTSLARMETALTAEQRKAITALTGKAPGAGAGPVPAPAATAAPAPARSPAAAPVRSPATGSWKVQLGAFGNRAGAEAQWRKLATLGSLSSASPDYVTVRNVIRLQAGPFSSKADASSACAAVRNAGQDCFVLRP